MKFLVLLFFASLLFGTVGGLPIAPGATIYIHDIMLVPLFFIALLFIIKKKKFRKPFLFAPIAVFIIVSLLSLLLNAYRFSPLELGQSALYLLRWMAYAGIYVIVVHRFVPVRLWMFGLFGAGLGFAVAGFLQYVFYPSLRTLEYLGWDPHYYRMVSTLLDPNFMGGIFVLTIFFALFLTYEYRRKWIIPVVGAFTGALYLTYSRSSYLAFAIGILYLVLRSVHSRMRGIIALFVFVLVVIIVPKPGGDTLRLDRMATTVARLENWQESFVRAKDSLIIGNGFNTLRFAFNRQTIYEVPVSKAAAGVDNSILFILLTTGVAGLAAYGWLVFKQIALGRHLLGKKKWALLGNVYIASMLAIFVHSMFVNSLFYPWAMIWMWVLAGVVEVTSYT